MGPNINKRLFAFVILTVSICLACANLPDTSREETQEQGTVQKVSLLDSAYDYGRKFFSRIYEKFDRKKSDVFEAFLKLYNKQYSGSELQKRMELFFDRKKQIDESKASYEEGKASFKMEVNEFADLDSSELKRLRGGVKVPPREELSEQEIEAIEEEEPDEAGVKPSKAPRHPDKLDRLLRDIPESRDWRDTNCVGSVYYQEDCSACYALAAMTVVDTMLCLKGYSRAPLSLSPQQIVDCARKDYRKDGYNNEGCANGWPTSVLRYLQEVGVATKGSCYPFIDKENEQCQLNNLLENKHCVVDVRFGKEKLKYKVLRGEREILYNVANVGPVVTLMMVTDKFHSYSEGIFEDLECANGGQEDEMYHAVTIVGYGQEKGVDYWIVRNSWGSDWGEAGHARYKRGVKMCSIGLLGWVVEP